jgi:hypothetical protein
LKHIVPPSEFTRKKRYEELQRELRSEGGRVSNPYLGEKAEREYGDTDGGVP